MIEHEELSIVKSYNMRTYTGVAIVTLVCIGLFGFGAMVGRAFDVEVKLRLSYINLALALSFAITGRVKWLRWTTMPTLVVMSAIGGIVVSLWARPPEIGGGLLFIVVDAILMSLLARWQVLKLGKLSGWLGLLGGLFSLMGLGVWVLRGESWVVPLWGAAAVLCFSMLLYNSISFVLYKLPSGKYIEGAVSIFLVSTGLLLNFLIMLG